MTWILYSLRLNRWYGDGAFHATAGQADVFSVGEALTLTDEYPGDLLACRTIPVRNEPQHIHAGNGTVH